MTNGLAYRKFIPGDNEDKLTPELKSELEILINDSFRERGMELIPDYFSLPIWRNFKYMALTRDTEDDNKIVGGLIAFHMRTPKGTDFMLYDKIFVHPGHRGHNSYEEMIKVARAIDTETIREIRPKNKHAIPAVLRTSDDGLTIKYGEISDEHFDIQNGNHLGGHAPILMYHVHLLGTKDPVTEKSLQGYIWKAGEIAEYVAHLPRTFQEIAA